MAPRKIEVSFDPYFFHVQGKIYFKIIHYKCEVNQMAFQPDPQGLHLGYPCYGEDPDTGWSSGTQILGA